MVHGGLHALTRLELLILQDEAYPRSVCWLLCCMYVESALPRLSAQPSLSLRLKTHTVVLLSAGPLLVFRRQTELDDTEVFVQSLVNSIFKFRS